MYNFDFDFDVNFENVPLDDCSLVSAISRLEQDTIKKKSLLDKILHKNNNNNYLELKLARLAYEFSREEYDVLAKEARKRGLTVVM